MLDIRQIAGPRFFAEAAAIVISILVAFWIDAWWEEKARIFGATPESPFNVNNEALRTREFWNLMFDWKVLYADQLAPLIRSRDRCDEVLNLLSIQIEEAGS